MRLFKLVLILFLLLTTYNISAVIEVKSVEDIFEQLKDADSSYLVVFDVDETLTLPKDPEFQRVNFEKHREKIEPLLKKITPRQRHFLMNMIMATGPSMLIEEKVVEGIKDLQNRSVKVLAFTSSLTAKIPHTRDLKESRLSEMKRLGLNFDASFPDLPPFVFFNQTPHFGYYPMFYNGVLFTNGYGNTKAEILKAFFREVDWKPKQLVIIDDKLNNLRVLEEEMEKEKIPHLCILYRGIDRFESPDVEDTEKLIDKWRSYIIKALGAYAELEQKNGF